MSATTRNTAPLKLISGRVMVDQQAKSIRIQTGTAEGEARIDFAALSTPAERMTVLLRTARESWAAGDVMFDLVAAIGEVAGGAKGETWKD